MTSSKTTLPNICMRLFTSLSSLMRLTFIRPSLRPWLSVWSRSLAVHDSMLIVHHWLTVTSMKPREISCWRWTSIFYSPLWRTFVRHMLPWVLLLLVTSSGTNLCCSTGQKKIWEMSQNTPRQSANTLETFISCSNQWRELLFCFTTWGGFLLLKLRRPPYL